MLKETLDNTIHRGHSLKKAWWVCQPGGALLLDCMRAPGAQLLVLLQVGKSRLRLGLSQ